MAMDHPPHAAEQGATGRQLQVPVRGQAAVPAIHRTAPHPACALPLPRTVHALAQGRAQVLEQALVLALNLIATVALRPPVSMKVPVWCPQMALPAWIPRLLDGAPPPASPAVTVTPHPWPSVEVATTQRCWATGGSSNSRSHGDAWLLPKCACPSPAPWPPHIPVSVSGVAHCRCAVCLVQRASDATQRA